MKKRYIYLILFVLVTVFIFSNSAQDADSSSQLSNGLLALVIRIIPFMTSHIIRKCAHFTEFFAQELCLSLYFKNTSKGIMPHAPTAVVCGFLTACLDEFSQNFSAGRAPGFGDVLIDLAGALTAVILVIIVSTYEKRTD